MRLYVVIAKQIEIVPGKAAWAGIGWTQEEEHGRGLFVEHHGNTRLKVQHDIQTSLKFMKKNRHINYGDIHEEMIGIDCIDQPVCAVVLAVFQAENWSI